MAIGVLFITRDDAPAQCSEVSSHVRAISSIEMGKVGQSRGMSASVNVNTTPFRRMSSRRSFFFVGVTDSGWDLVAAAMGSDRPGDPVFLLGHEGKSSKASSASAFQPCHQYQT